MSWTEIAIGDLGRVVTGDTPPRKNPEYYGDAYPFIKPTDMGVGERLTLSYEEGYSEDGFTKYRKKLIPAGSTAVVTIGSIGQKLTWLHADCFVNQAVNAVVPDVNRFDCLYVYYLLKHNLSLVKQADTGASSGRENVSKSNFSALKVWACLDKDTQKRIAEVLDAIDSSIETNQRRIALLEDAARRLYREWFVQLRFPGHESVTVKDGVPQGWSRKPLGNIATLNYGKALKATERKDGNVPVYGSSGIVGFHNVALVGAGAIVVGRKGNVGSLYYSHEPCFPIDTVFFISPDKASYRLFLALHQLNFISSDAAVPGLNRTYAQSLPLLLPTEEVQTEFERLAAPMFEQIQGLTQHNRQLAQARDLLLPKLMSGQLDVSAIALPDKVAA